MKYDLRLPGKNAEAKSIALLRSRMFRSVKATRLKVRTREIPNTRRLLRTVRDLDVAEKASITKVRNLLFLTVSRRT